VGDVKIFASQVSYHAFNRHDVAGGVAIGVCEALLTPVPVVGPFRTAVPFVFAVVALLWMQRKSTFVYR